ncbi:uncharacterized protein ACLA_024670 [Aspergillus clavatus NRRL 1]|uniref:Ubiquitin-like protein smt3 n=1 Tax=Aspergillus clavatus (strain ATCC 1007 / CBS 513.65 / DSM 816 / NCTC 3887 / NRRL 1 / QM 1276 / 107) TaxID=344612 RepID=A1CQ30_ASPCL|nr:uncharacterized protein ACLA_024670 [Aspergillus clavatus NRRL 1]EAW07751.1 conserved hypothetical protein [Aspergillus clavatus NRRL 1]
MSISASTTEALESSVRQLSLANNARIKDIPRPAVKPPAKKKAPVVADSWEDEADSDSDSEPAPAAATATAISPSVSAEGPLDPPPTPISPQLSQQGLPLSGASPPMRAVDARSPARRPEKQTAVAGRLIAGALGLRAPKRTEEQRAYDRAVKEKEMKRRNREREEEAKRKEEEERAKAAVWDDTSG